MYIRETTIGTFWIRLDPEKNGKGWFGLGRDDEWLGSFPSIGLAVREVNRQVSEKKK